ncbi:MAG: peptidoglycan DD-metalloendopeptidase family protein [Gammaproteobacteria bacterium]
MTVRRARDGNVGAAVKLCVVLLLAVAAGCSSLAPTEHEPTRVSRASVHVVRRGETLYQIAWQHRLDQRDLARWNGIRNPDALRVGQRLVLAPPRTTAVARRSARATPSRTSPPPPVPPPQPMPAWLWPTDGAVVMGFGSPNGIASGIAIGGREGQPVRAAAAGHVVYAGSGLIGYGQLVILKHNDTYLSAYGHNSRLLVSQGQDVTAGATIALMGVGPERQPRLHFEIRRDGVPVDPLQFLRPVAR